MSEYGHAGMTVIGAIRNSLKKLAAVALSSPQIPHGKSRLALYLNGLLVESVPTGWRDKLHLKLFQQDGGTNFT